MTYPLGVVAAKLQAVQDLHATAGRRGAGADLSGAGVFLTDYAGTELVDVRMPFKGGVARLWAGRDSGGNPKGRPLLKVLHSTLDLEGGNNQPHALIGGGNGVIIGARLLNAPRQHINWTGSLALYETLVGAFGTNPRVDSSGAPDHNEPIEIDGGFFQSVNCLYDASYGLPILQGITAGTPFLKSTSAETFALFDGNVVMGLAKYAMPWTFQFKADRHPITVVLSNNALEKGSSGYFGIDAKYGFACRVVNGGGNFDLVTGAPIVW